MLKALTKTTLLFLGIYLIAYFVSTPGVQLWQALIGGTAIGVFVGIDN